MPGPYGVTSTGFVIKPLDQILSDIEDAELAGISSNLNIQPTDPIGVINGIFAQAIYDIWQLGAALYNGMDPDQASGDQLDGLSLITGTLRSDATPTLCEGCVVNVDNGFSQPAKTMLASISGLPSVLFTNKSSVSNSSGITSDETVDFVAVDPGPQQCLSGTLTVISTPLSGWNSITNPTDGIVGTAVQTDSDLRKTRNSELAATGAGTASGIKAAILSDPRTSTTKSVIVLYNDTGSFDINGLPPSTINVIAYLPGYTLTDDDNLAAVILENKAAGISTQGNTTVTGTDQYGNVTDISFTRPSPVTINVVVNVTRDTDVYSSSAACQTAVHDAITAYADSRYLPGDTVYYEALLSQCFQDRPGFSSGVLDVTSFTINSGTANLSIPVTSIAVIGTVTVTST